MIGYVLEQIIGCYGGFDRHTYGMIEVDPIRSRLHNHVIAPPATPADPTRRCNHRSAGFGEGAQRVRCGGQPNPPVNPAGGAVFAAPAD